MEWLGPLVQLLGTLVTILGLLVVAPYAAGQAAARLVLWVRWALHQARGGLARVLPFLRTDAQVQAKAATLTSPLPMRDAVVAELTPGIGGTVAEQLASLHRTVALINAELAKLRSTQSELSTELRQQVDRINAEIAELKRQQEKKEEQARHLDARGFPLAAVGALVAGWPGAWSAPWLALLPWLPWLTVPVGLVGLVALVVAGRWLVHGPDGGPGAWSEVRQGWAETLGSEPDSSAATPDTGAGGTAQTPEEVRKVAELEAAGEPDHTTWTDLGSDSVKAETPATNSDTEPGSSTATGRIAPTR